MLQRWNVPVIHFQLVRRFRLRVSHRVEITDADDIVESLRAHRSGIHAQAAAHFAGNSFHPFQAADASGFARVGHFLQLRAGPGRDFISADLHFIEITAGWMNDHAANSAVADEEIGTAPDDKKRQIFAPAKPDHLGKRRFRARLDPELRRPSNAQRRVFRQRFVKPHVTFLADDGLQIFGDDQIGGEQ